MGKYNLNLAMGSQTNRGLVFAKENVFYVDGNLSGSGDGRNPDVAVLTVTEAINVASMGGIIYIRPKMTTASAQSYYQEDIVLPLTKPNLQLLGAVPDGCTGAQSGPQFKPYTVTGHMVDVKGANCNLENLRLTLSGGTAAAGKCIVHAVNNTAGTQKPSGLVIRGCRFENDKSYPTYTGTEAVASIGLGSVRDVIITKCTFYNCIGGICQQETSGIPHMLEISENIFAGPTTVRDCDILMSWGDGVGLAIVGNYFLDGLPAASSGGYKRFVQIIGAGTGIMANNYFATTTDSFTAAGSQCIIPNTFFAAHNYINDGVTTQA